MPEKIKVLVVDDIRATRENIRKLLEFNPEIVFVGEAGTADAAIEQVRLAQPDVILMDVNMPGMDGINAAALISSELPGASIVIMSVQAEQEYLRKAMVAGAKDYLTKPFTGDELLQAIKQVYANEQRRRKVVTLEPRQPEPGKIVTIFSTKGGVGKTTIATNLAVALAANTTGQVGIVDGDLQFGDVAMFMNLMPRVTIADLVKDIDNLDDKVLGGYLTSYNGNLKVLAAPIRPEQAEMVSAAHLSAILKTMRNTCKYVVVDTTPTFSETVLAALDLSDLVLVVADMDLPAIKNVKLCLEIMDSLEYQREKIRLVLNRADAEGGMDPGEVEESLRRTFAAVLPSDGKTVMTSVNRGIPFVASNPDTTVAKRVFGLAKAIAMDDWQEKRGNKGMAGTFRRLFG